MPKPKHLIGYQFDRLTLCPYCLSDILDDEHKTIQTIRDADGNPPQPIFTTDFYDDEDPTCQECGTPLFDN